MAVITRATEQDFTDLSDAVYLAQQSGNAALALRLDKIARQANASCTNSKFAWGFKFGTCKPITWKQVPSTLL